MSENNKMKNTGSAKKKDGKFPSKNVKHDPQAESARAVFGLREAPPREKNSPNP